MDNFIAELKQFFRKGDMILLVLCLVTTAFGCLVIASTTQTMSDASRYVPTQIFAALIGVLLYALISSIDSQALLEQRFWLTVLNVGLLLLLIPFGTDNGTGNKSWLNIPLVPVDIQPAELCKIFFVLVLASVMGAHQNRISHPVSVLHIAFHTGLIVGLNLILSRDMGVSMIFVFIFIVMAYSGGVNVLWFLAAIAATIGLFPFIWNNVFSEYQRLRFEVLINPDLDPLGIGARYHTVRSLKSLTGGGLTGQGLFNGTRTQTPEALYAQHTDYIFSAIGEELGFLGCLLVLVLLFAIVARCIWVGAKTPDYPRKMICFGCAGALIFQIMINVGMCMGVAPVIGLTLPFISYGGSSIISLYAMMGLVSGVHARPAPVSHELYIRPPKPKSYL